MERMRLRMVKWFGHRGERMDEGKLTERVTQLRWIRKEKREDLKGDGLKVQMTFSSREI